jgi:hypothetical protein
MVNGKRLCYFCQLAVDDPLYFAKIYRNVCDDREKSYRELRESRQRVNDVFSLTPPIDILKKAKIALNVTGFYSSFSQVLASYYKISRPSYIVHPQGIPENAFSCYIPSKNEVYCKESPYDLNTAFHEFYHALENFDIAPYESESKEREKNAENFANACVQLLETTA